MLTHHDERSARIRSPAKHVFAYVDDHTHLSSRMSQMSWKMGEVG